MNDAILVEQALDGDHQAFHILITRYYTAIHNMILSWVRDSEDAKDLTQEAFISAYQKLPTLKRPESFYAWLQQIARRRCQNWQRNMQGNLIALQDDLISKEPPVDEVLILRETLAKVMEAIDNLPESEKGLLKERYLDDTSYDELSARHGVSTKALVVRLVRTRRKIKEYLGKTLSAFVAFFHRHSESILTGGVEIMKLSVKTKLIAGGIAVMLATGATGVLVKHYALNQQAKPAVEQAKSALPKINMIPKVVKPVRKEIPKATQKDNEEAIAFLDELKRESQPAKPISTISPAQSEDKPLSYEEELTQRYLRIKKTPEFQALMKEGEILREKMELAFTPEWLVRESCAFFENEYSILGMTREEGMRKMRKGQLSQEQLDIMRETRLRYMDEVEEYQKRQMVIKEDMRIVLNKQLDLLGMTWHEFVLARRKLNSGTR